MFYITDKKDNFCGIFENNRHLNPYQCSGSVYGSILLFHIMDKKENFVGILLYLKPMDTGIHVSPVEVSMALFYYFLHCMDKLGWH